MRAALPAFDARLQAELLNRWETEVLSRSGLSAVVFEQKLRAAENASAPTLRVLPSDFLVLSVLDQLQKELRVFVNPVGTGMALGSPKVFPIKNPGEVANLLPGEVARHVAGVAGLVRRSPTIQKKNQEGKPLVCSLLEPVGAGGAQRDLSTISPLIRAVLEDVVGSDDTGATLVERTEMAKLIDEKTLAATNGLNTNVATDLGRIVKADLLLIPFIHFGNSGKISTDLFAVDVATGRMLACRSWSGALLDAPPSGIVKELLQEGLRLAGEFIARPVADDPALRHSEAGFIISLNESWDGLRQRVATEAELSIRLADASLALANDNPAIMRNAAVTFYREATPGALYPLQNEYDPTNRRLLEIRELKKSGQLGLIYNQARRVFELPMTELAKDNDEKDLRYLGELWTRLGDAQKGWDILTRGGQPVDELVAKSPFYQSMMVTLMNLGRYQECIDLLDRRGRWNSLCTSIMLDACRALNDTKREFSLMWRNPSSACKTDRMAARFLNLGREQGQADAVMGRVIATANSWVMSSLSVRMAMIQARISAGQKELAIADAQCTFIAATKEKDNATQKEIIGILAELGTKPIASLPAAHEFLTLPADCRIDLIHDQTVDPKYVSEVADHVARFWGCAVHIRAIRLDASQSSSYRKLSQSLEGNVFADTVARVAMPAGPKLGTVFLTQTKLVSKKQNYEGDIYSVPIGSLLVLSDHYFRKFKASDPRPLPLITAIAAANLGSVWKMLRLQSREERALELVFCPPPPDLFTSNGNLHLAAINLGVSPYTGALLRKISTSELLKSIPEIDNAYRQKAPSPIPADEAIILDLDKQISQASPIIITP
jgi:hypothetical protein